MIMHIDGNSFYASCERLFRPDLTHAPIAVLSNNDGIIIALNRECKDLGFKRGDVFFESKEKLQRSGVVIFSSNYTLYSDISSRINVVYYRYTPDVEVYSIDESFLYFPGWKNADYSNIALSIKEAVEKEIGIPVSVGIAPTKTLAKICNKLAKKRGGVCEWQALDTEAELSKYPVEDIWGIGHAKAELLKRQNIQTALDLKNYPLDKAKKHLTITGFRTVQELNGIPAIDKTQRESRQTIICSKSFSAPVYTLDEITKALSDYTQEAIKRMRDEKLTCKYATVFLMTNAFAQGDQYCNQASAELPQPTAYFPIIMHTAETLLRRIYRKGYKYRKVMINLTGLESAEKPQLDLFTDYETQNQQERIMQCFDHINTRYGRNTIGLGSNLLVKKTTVKTVESWEMKRQYLSPEYTTRLTDIPKVK